MTTLTVGQGQQFSTISAAIAASQDGDVVQVQAGTYVNDFAEIRTKITLQGVGGMVHMVATGPIPNDKGILVVDTDATIDHFEFSGATGPSGNAAGVRYQGGALTLTNDYFHDNQNGLLSNPSTTGTITIKTSEFAHNGAGDGYTHNLYVGDIAKLTIQDSYFHDAVVGHEIKSRAEVTEISNTRIYDNTGSASYSIDLPNGGKATLTNNIIEQGPNSANPNIVAYGEEGSLHANSTLTLSGGSVLNDLGKGTLLWDASGSSASISGVSVWGLADSQIASGSGVTVSSLTHLGSEPSLDTSHPWGSAGSSSPPVVDQLCQAVLREPASSADVSALAANLSAQLNSGSMTDAQAADEVVKAAAATTSVASLAYEFFTGSVPTAAGIDYLISPAGPNPNNLNSSYYQSFNLENRYINFAVNLGKAGAGTAGFQSSYGALSLFDATKQAYTTIFGGAPSDAKVHALLDPVVSIGGQNMTRADYFALYGGDGASGIGTKAAMVGWLLAEAVKADLGTYAKSNDAFLSDVALHNAPFGVDIIGHYAQSGFVFQPG